MPSAPDQSDYLTVWPFSQRVEFIQPLFQTSFSKKPGMMDVPFTQFYLTQCHTIETCHPQLAVTSVGEQMP